MTISFLLIVLASFFLGTFGLGMKYNKPLAWEAFWAIHAITGMLIVPLIWGLIVVPDLFQSILTAPPDAIFKGILFGFIWGIGGVMFGISVRYVGVSLTYGVVMGTTGAIGGLVPLFQMEGFASQSSFPMILLGVFIMIAGVAVIAMAGLKREKRVAETGVEIEGIKRGKEFRTGIIIVTISGVLSAFINIGFANALPVADNAVTYGASTINASLAAWIVVLIGAITFNMLYSIVLLTKNKTWGTFALPGIGKAVKWAVLAALLWFGSLGVYGLGAAKMGTLGTVIGWPVFVGLSLIFSNFWAIRAGEWKGMKKPIRLLIIGVAILIAATIILAFANMMSAN
jgi:L-rhamnose-H+ transport protein